MKDRELLESIVIILKGVKEAIPKQADLVQEYIQGLEEYIEDKAGMGDMA